MTQSLFCVEHRAVANPARKPAGEGSLLSRCIKTPVAKRGLDFVLFADYTSSASHHILTAEYQKADYWAL